MAQLPPWPSVTMTEPVGVGPLPVMVREYATGPDVVGLAEGTIVTVEVGDGVGVVVVVVVVGVVVGGGVGVPGFVPGLVPVVNSGVIVEGDVVEFVNVFPAVVDGLPPVVAGGEVVVVTVPFGEMTGGGGVEGDEIVVGVEPDDDAALIPGAARPLLGAGVFVHHQRKRRGRQRGRRLRSQPPTGFPWTEMPCRPSS